MTHHWEALGWTLVHFLWQGAAIALVYRVADLALARHSANARYALALVALLGMLGVSVATLAYEENIAASQHVHTAVFIAGGAHAGSRIEQTAADRSLADRSTADRSFADRFSADFVLGHLLPYLDGLWLAGVLLLSIRALGGWWLIRRMRARLERAPHTLLLRLDVLRRRMNIGQFVDLRVSSKLTNPLTAGVAKPWILLPITALTSLSAEQLEVVLAHELAHIRRADYLWNLLQTMVETLFFFHPAVWWVSRRVREERELCCDDIAVRSCSDPTVYASALLRLEEERRTRLHLAMALDGHQSRAGLRARILRILGDGEAAPRSFRPISLAGIATLLIVFLCPLPKVFASFRAVPAVAARIAPTARKVVFKAMHPAMQASEPTPAPAPTPKTSAAVPVEDAQESPSPAPAAAPQPSTHTDYIDAMKAAGYDVDLDKYIAMKVQGITPEYAAEMSKAFGEKLSADKLIGLKVQDVTADYIAKMRAAGYDVDANKFISMKVQGITSEYAAEMSKVFGEKLSADKLIALRVQGVDPDYMAKMRAAGYDADANKFIAMRVQGITPEFAEDMAKVGFGKPSVDQLISLRVQGVTPEFAAKLHADGIEVTSFNDLITYRIFNVSPEFFAEMKSAGFGDIPAKKLVALRVQGVTPEFAKDMKAQFGNVTLDDLIQLRVFGIDPEFIASAKRHGFEPLTVQKLVKLRISGILDDANDTRQ
jgi:beta-lactamase regulating signal transducer with metallopeptidase domain